VTVVANHQLVPHVRYPGGADDIQLAREWILNNIASEKYGKGSVDKVILFGHSSGGAHIAANLYAAGKENSRSRMMRRAERGALGDPKRVPKQAIFPPVAGVMFFSTPFWFDRTRPIRQRTLRQYYGSDAEEVWGASVQRSLAGPRLTNRAAVVSAEVV